MNENKNRATFQSRLGFILVSAGCAIGLGNVWKFPYICGQNGGGAFLFLYLICLVLLGLPILICEFAIGRGSNRSLSQAFNRLEKPGSRYHCTKYTSIAGNYLLMMFYTTVCGWMLAYMAKMATGTFDGLDPDGVAGVFGTMLANPSEMVGWMLAVVVIGFFVCSLGLQKGVERITKVMMIALLGVMALLVVRSVTLPGAAEGLEFYLVPDFGKMFAGGLSGFGDAVYAAMGQAFFTLSLGISAMEVFGSRIGKQNSLTGEALRICGLDTAVAILAGLIIFPACFTYQVEVGSGPSLIFVTLPNVFNNMPMGNLWGALFFVFMTFAAFSTVLAVFENILSCCMDMFGWSRKKACLINCLLLLVLSLPCALGFNLLAEVHPLGGSTTFLDLEDFLVSNILLPLGSLIFVIFAVSKRGWGWKKFMEEANAGRGWKVKNWMRGYITYVLPIIIIALFVIGLVTYFMPK